MHIYIYMCTYTSISIINFFPEFAISSQKLRKKKAYKNFFFDVSVDFKNINFIDSGF